jgi:acyl phosphate:glycerol-3-phosphate acyltransferase
LGCAFIISFREVFISTNLKFMAYLFYFGLPLFIGYLLGSIPFGYIVGKAYGIDLTKEGSGSTGTTNALRLIGKKAAFFVLLGDFLKGFLAPFAGILLLKYSFSIFLMTQAPELGAAPLVIALSELVHSQLKNLIPVAAILASLGALIGHVKSCWIGFKGGKAVATGVGTLFALDWRVGLITAIIWATIVFTTKYSSLGALIAVPLSPIIMFVFKRFYTPSVGFFDIWVYTGYCILGAIYIIYKHKANIGRLLNNTEPKIGQKKMETQSP